MFKLYEIKQSFSDEKLKDIKGTIQEELSKGISLESLPENANIAVTAGSRGISNIVEILKCVVETLKAMGLSPFIVPAMGSHGGATDEGQIEVLSHLGITEEVLGVPVRSSMETIFLGETPNGNPVYMDKIAYESDGIIVINRIKSHTAFQGKVESGLSKMITIGLGKKKGATYVHSDGALKMADNILDVSSYALKHSPILMGLGIVENGYDETAKIVGVKKEEWHDKENELLKLSKSMMPSLPVENIDLLIVEEMGKCFSGTGMDPVIIGRWRIQGVPEPERPIIKKITVLDLAEKSHGNAQGIGLADFTTERLINKVDRKSTYTNALTSTYLQRAMFPLFYSSEQEVIETAIQSLGPDCNMDQLKVVQIPNTLHLGTVYVSEPILQELKKSNRKFSLTGEHIIGFNDKGDVIKRITH